MNALIEQSYFSRPEELTKRFYEWEVRGRGWNVYDYAVVLEPPFEQFSSIESYTPKSQIDDGRRPTLLSNFADTLKDVFSSSSKKTISPSLTQQIQEVLPSPYTDDSEIIELIISLPSSFDVSREYAEHLIMSLSSNGLPLSFEILGTHDKIVIQFACREENKQAVKQHIHSFFPDMIIKEGSPLSETLSKYDRHTAIVDCGLSEEFMRPLRSFKHFSPDPLTAIFTALEYLEKGDVGLVQVLFQEVEAPWAVNMLQAVRNDDGSSFFKDAPEMVSLAEEKVMHPLFAVVLRFTAQSQSDRQAWELVKSLYSGMNSFTNPISNEFIPLSNDGYSDDTHLEDVIKRTSHRSGMILNSEELLGLVHFPSPSLYSLKLRRDNRKTHSVHPVALNHSFILGENIHQNVVANVSLSTEQRLRHIHIIGKTGTGKSTLLLNMMKQDIDAGRGIAVLDPHGDLIDKALDFIPEGRLEDVVLFDPGDRDFPIGINILEAHSEIERTVLSSDLTELFRRFSTTWGDQMTTVLSNAIAAITESGGNKTLIDLKRFLLESEFRDDILQQDIDPSIIYFWKKEFPLLRGGSQVSILTRLDELLRSKTIRNIVAQPEGLDFSNIIETKKIFLGKLSQGIIGEQNAHLLGSLICSKLHQAVMSRQSLKAVDRSPFFFYIDEFQHFATPSMASILSGSRKYALGLILAHQELQQISLTQSPLMNSVISNPATRICFALGDFDANKLEDGFAHFDRSDLQNLGVGEAIVRVEQKEYDFNLKTFELPEILIEESTEKQKKIIALSRRKYAQQIEIKINQVLEAITIQPEPISPTVSTPISRYLVKREKIVSEKKSEISFAKESITHYDTSRHRYLQTLIKKMAEQRGYRAVIEETTPDGGRVDVGLERNGKKIAVEISVTTGEAHELGNIEKCLITRYDTIIVCSPEKKNLEAIKKLTLQKLPASDQKKILFFEPDEVIQFLDATEKQEVHTEQRIKGYRVKVHYQAVSEVEQSQKRDAVAQVIVKSLKKMKEKS